MSKLLYSLACFAMLAGGSAPALAQANGSLRVDFLGPGGHSSGAYGRTSALHAAGRAAMLIQQSLPMGSYVVTNLTGGNSVNSIASDGLIEIRLSAANGTALQAMVTAVTNAAATGATLENEFRGVKPGDLAGGAPAHIRYAVTDTTAGPRPNPLRQPPKSFSTKKFGDHDHADPNHVCNW